MTSWANIEWTRKTTHRYVLMCLCILSLFRDFSEISQNSADFPITPQGFALFFVLYFGYMAFQPKEEMVVRTSLIILTFVYIWQVFGALPFEISRAASATIATYIVVTGAFGVTTTGFLANQLGIEHELIELLS